MDTSEILDSLISDSKDLKKIKALLAGNNIHIQKGHDGSWFLVKPDEVTLRREKLAEEFDNKARQYRNIGGADAIVVAEMYANWAKDIRDESNTAFPSPSVFDNLNRQLAEHDAQKDGERLDSEIVDFLATMWETESKGHYLMGRWFPNETGSFRDAIRAKLDLARSRGEEK